MNQEIKRYGARSVGVAIALIILQLALTDTGAAYVFNDRTTYSFIVSFFVEMSYTTFRDEFFFIHVMLLYIVTLFFAIGHYSDR